MGLFVDTKNNFNVIVDYVFDKDGQVHIVSEEDRKSIKEGKFEDGAISIDDAAFNTPILLKDYKADDLKSAKFIFKRPSLGDASKILKHVPGENMQVGQMLEYANSRFKILFLKGTAQDEKGGMVNLDSGNVELLSMNICARAAVLMSDHLDF